MVNAEAKLRRICLALTAIGCLGLAGCYERVIREDGIGAHRTIEEPYAEDWPVETIGRELQQLNTQPRENQSRRRAPTFSR